MTRFAPEIVNLTLEHGILQIQFVLLTILSVCPLILSFLEGSILTTTSWPRAADCVKPNVKTLMCFVRIEALRPEQIAGKCSSLNDPAK